MPELPEVETTVRGLRKKVLSRTIIDVWSDWEKMVKKPPSMTLFKKGLKGRKIERVWRRAKNVIFDLSGGYSLLIHQKMTGHLMVGKWRLMEGKWQPVKKGPFQDKINLFIHLMLLLDDGNMVALSDYRKFGKAELWRTSELLASKEFARLGPEPLEKGFTVTVFKNRLRGKKGRIKQVIMDPSVLAGVGNIYASEALWWAKIHPKKSAANLRESELQALYLAIIKVLKAGVRLGGESFADYRNVEGKKGRFDDERKAYNREGEPCFRCGVKIERLKFGGRSSFFCPRCQ